MRPEVSPHLRHLSLPQMPRTMTMRRLEGAKTSAAADRETELAKKLLAKRRNLFEWRRQQLPANNDDHEEEDDRAAEHVRIDGFAIPKKSENSSLGSDSLTAKNTLKESST